MIAADNEKRTSLTVHRTIISRRKTKKLTQKQMALLLGVSRRMYQRIEKGNGHIDEVSTVLDILDLKLLIIVKEVL